MSGEAQILDEIESLRSLVLCAASTEVIREAGLCELLKVSPNTARKIRKGDPSFPKRVVIFGDAEGWLRHEVVEWLLKRERSKRH